MAYSEIPQAYVDGLDVPRDFGQKTRDNFIAHEDRVTSLETAFGSWQALSLQNGWSPRSSRFTPSIRLVPGNKAEFIGEAIGGTITNGTIIANVGISFQPAFQVKVPLIGNDGHTYGLQVDTNGDLSLFHTDGAFNSIILTGQYLLGM